MTSPDPADARSPQDPASDEAANQAAVEAAIARRRLWLRLALVPLLIATGFVLLKLTPLGELMTGERIIGMLQELRQEPWAPLVLIAGFVFTGPIGLPVSPFILGGGAVFGPWLGTLYNSIGLMGNCWLTYSIGKMIGRDAVMRLAGPKFRRAERLVSRKGFWPLIQIRFLPVPAPVVNYAASLAGLKLPRFMLTSALGLIPSCAVHTYFGPKLIFSVLEKQNPTWLTVKYAIALGILNVVVLGPQIRTALYRRRRYRQLLEERAGRGSS